MLVDSTRPRRTTKSALFKMVEQGMDRRRPHAGRPANRLANANDSRYGATGLFSVFDHD